MPTTSTTNPFIFDRPVAPTALIGREHELELLAHLARGGQNSRLVAPRRYGKTSLLGSVGERLRAERFVFVHADFSRVRRLDDVALRLKAAWEKALSSTSGMRRFWRQLDKRVGAYMEIGVPGVARGGITIASADRRRPLEAVHELLAIPEHLPGTRRRAFVVFDEFPELLTVSDDLDGIVRSHIQHHGGTASYCFAGSQASAMRALFEDRRRALFAQARDIELGPLQEDQLRSWLADRLSRDNGAAANSNAEALAQAVYDQTRGHPQRAMMLAHFVWERLPASGPDEFRTALSMAIKEASGEIEQMWSNLNPGQRRALAAAAAGYRHLLGPSALAASGTAKTTMQAARKALLAEGYLREHERGGVEPTDPFVALWLEQADATD